MKVYLDLLQEVLNNGEWKNQRATTKDGKSLKTLSISGAMIKHDLRDGFPLITTKFVSLKNINVELEFFIKGLSDKKWLQNRNCHIWDDWKNPHTSNENDLGRIYGVQWRSWRTYDFSDKPKYIDQLKNSLYELKNNPFSRRIIISAWNPSDIHEMALPPCHYSFQLLSNGIELDLLWNQRSWDLPAGAPYNIASYAMLLMIIAKLVNMTPRYLICHANDVHIYENQIEQMKSQIKREPYKLPKVSFKNDFNNIDEWTCDNYLLENYNHHPKINLEIAV